MRTAILALLFCWAGASAHAEDRPFFVFDNGLRGDRWTTIDAQLDLAKEIGFDGLSWRTDSPERIKQVLDGAKRRGLKVFAIYCNIDLKDGKAVYDQRLREIIPLCKGSETMLWPNITSKQYPRSSPEGDDAAVAGLRELAELCEPNGLRIALYPHVNMWLHRVEDAIRVVKKVERKNVGLTFNLCHALLDGAEPRVPELIEQAAPYLFLVSINGADSGASPKEMARNIQRLDQGTYDVGAVLRKLDEVGYRGPIGLQCYQVPGPADEMLRRSMDAWRKLTAKRP